MVGKLWILKMMCCDCSWEVWIRWNKIEVYWKTMLMFFKLQSTIKILYKLQQVSLISILPTFASLFHSNYQIDENSFLPHPRLTLQNVSSLCKFIFRSHRRWTISSHVQSVPRLINARINSFPFSMCRALKFLFSIPHYSPPRKVHWPRHFSHFITHVQHNIAESA